MGSLAIRSWSGPDAAEIDALLESDPDPLLVQQLHSLHGPPRDGQRWRRTLVAVAGADSLVAGSLVGAVSLARNGVTAGRVNAVVEVAPAWRRQGVGTRLVDAARSRDWPTGPWVSKVWAEDSRAVGFMSSVGAAPYQRCPGVRLAPASAELFTWIRDNQPGVGDSVGPLRRLSVDELTEAWTEFYEWIHASWAPPVARASLLEAFVDIAADIDADLSTGVWSGGRLAAAAFVLPEVGGSYTICAETIRADETRGRELVSAALADCLQRLRDAGVDSAVLDGHVTDPHLAPLLSTLPAAGRRELLLVLLSGGDDESADPA